MEELNKDEEKVLQSTESPETLQDTKEEIAEIAEATENDIGAEAEAGAEGTEGEVSTPKRPGKYKYHMSRDNYYAALMSLEKANGHHKMYRNVAMLLLLCALLPIYDMIRNPGYFLAILSSGALVVLATWIKDVDRRNAHKIMRKVSKNGINFTLDLKKEGIMVHDGTAKPLLMPYSHFKSGYEHGDYLSLITTKNISLNMPVNFENYAFCSIRNKFLKELSEHYKIVSDNKK